MAAVKLVTVDVTNTIIRVLNSVGYHYAKVAKDYGVVLDVLQVDKSHKAALKKMNASFPMYGCNHGLSCRQWWNKVIIDTLSQSGVKNEAVVEGVAGRLYSEFSGAGCWEVFEDVHPTLAELKERGMTIGIVSNFDERLDGILASLDIAKYLDFTVATYKIKCAKPNPRMFREALKIASVDAANAIHIGDDYEMDYLTPKSVGMRALWLIRSRKEFSEEPADSNKAVHSLQELLTYARP